MLIHKIHKALNRYECLPTAYESHLAHVFELSAKYKHTTKVTNESENIITIVMCVVLQPNPNNQRQLRSGWEAMGEAS